MAQAELEKLREILRNFDTGMLVTHAGNDRLHGRPMAVAQVEDSGDLWFITDVETPKMDEIRSNEQVLVSFQDERNQYVTVSGRAEMVRDRQKVDELWKEPFRVWFPEGQDDPRLVLIHVRPEVGEYWDQSGINKITYAFQALGAYASGNRPDVREGRQHGQVNL